MSDNITDHYPLKLKLNSYSNCNILSYEYFYSTNYDMLGNLTPEVYWNSYINPDINGSLEAIIIKIRDIVIKSLYKKSINHNN